MASTLVAMASNRLAMGCHLICSVEVLFRTHTVPVHKFSCRPFQAWLRHSLEWSRERSEVRPLEDLVVSVLEFVMVGYCITLEVADSGRTRMTWIYTPQEGFPMIGQCIQSREGKIARVQKGLCDTRMWRSHSTQAHKMKHSKAVPQCCLLALLSLFSAAQVCCVQQFIQLNFDISVYIYIYNRRIEGHLSLCAQPKQCQITSLAATIHGA